MTLLDLLKSSPTASSVHIAGAICPKCGKRKCDHTPMTLGKLLGFKQRTLRRYDGKTSAVPFKYEPDALANLRPDQVPRFLGALTTPDRLEMKTIDLNEVFAIQNRVDPEKVESLRRQRGGKPAIVVRLDGRDLIADGHHRLVAEWLNGIDQVPVRYLNLMPLSNAMKRTT